MMVENDRVRLTNPGIARQAAESSGRIPNPGMVPADAWGQEGTIFFFYSSGFNLGGHRALEVRLGDGRDCPVMENEIELV